MSDSGQHGGESPLLSERGVTIISDTVVTSIAGMAAQEVDGVHMGGGASRAAGGVLGGLTGSESKTTGISVEVGRTEAAIDLKMGIEYNRNILQAVEEVRRRITDRVQTMTGLRITELNATITDITFPEKEARRRLGSASATRERDASADSSTTAREQPPASEPDTGASERDTTQVETRSRTETEAPPEEEAGAERRPPEGEEAATPDSGETRAEEQRTTEASGEAETRAQTETSEAPETSAETSAETRRRRRAEERARRRRRTEDS